MAESIGTSRRAAAEALRASSGPGRFVALALSALPLFAVAGAAALDPAYLLRLTGALAMAQVGAGLLLAVVGAWWLHRRGRPPFSSRRARRRDEAATCRIEDALEQAAFYAVTSKNLKEALALVADEDPLGSAPRLAALLAMTRDELAAEESTPEARCVRTLRQAVADGASPAQALRAVASRLRVERRWRAPNGVLEWAAVFAAPLLLCTLPASALLLLV